MFHVHGEVGESKLILGYSEGKFRPEPYVFDYTMKGRTTTLTTIADHIDSIEDPYIRTAYENLYDKVRGFSKTPNIEGMKNFLIALSISEIIVIGHAYKIDSEYFFWLNKKFPDALWTLGYHTCEDEIAARKLSKSVGFECTYMYI